MKKVVFVDRDGTIVREPPDEQVDSLEKLALVPGIITGLKLLVDSGFTLVMVSNQDGLGRKGYPRSMFRTVQGKIFETLAGEGIRFEKVFICPHRAADGCRCRKPKAGLVDFWLKRTRIDRERSFLLGDRNSDVEFANNIGVRSVLVSPRKRSRAMYTTADAFDACSFIARSVRSSSAQRRTKEISITARVALDGSGRYGVSTGIGFFDHMLAQLARHSRIDLTLKADGDLHVDEHHTVEDVGIVLGEAIRSALGDLRGLDRYGYAAPMDEARADVVLDLSGRPFVKFRCVFRRDQVGGLPTELVEDFFRAFANGLKATIHITCRGRNDHHKIESIFKAVALALRDATRADRRSDRNALPIPSTKGKL